MNYDETTSVQCTISGGDLPISFTWLLNGAEVDSFLDVSIEKRGKRISSLMIESLTAKHSGNYTCRAKNVAGVAEHTSNLIVNGSSSQHTYSLNCCFSSVLWLFLYFALIRLTCAFPCLC